MLTHPILQESSVFSTGGTRLSLLYIARIDSPILDNFYNKVPSFQIGPFSFVLTDNEHFEDFHDFSVYAITLGEETVQVLIGVVDTSTITCGSKSNINVPRVLVGYHTYFCLPKVWDCLRTLRLS